MTHHSAQSHSIARLVGGAGISLLVWLAAAGGAHAVACPSGGAKVDVCVFNPTNATTPMISVSGSFIANEITCTGPPPIVASYSASFTVGAGQTYCTPGGIPSNGLLSGMYVHRIQVAGTTQNQFQQRPVMASSGTRARIDWTYMPNVITVNVAGDSGSGNCPVNSVSSPAACDIRTAAAAAKAVTGTLPVLIQLATSPGTFTGVNLVLERDNLVIDGTDASGNPWIVGDANAAAAGNQDPFSRVLELSPFRAVWIRANNVTLKGLEIRHPPNSETVSLSSLVVQFSPFAGARLDSVRLDMNSTVDCTLFPEDCDGTFSLVTLLTRPDLPVGRTMTMVNVEGRSAIYQGVDVLPKNDLLLQRSWLRNNLHGNVRADTAVVRLERSVIERAGLRASDDRSMISTARGVFLTRAVDGLALLATEANVIRNNRSFGVSSTGFANVVPQDDAVCGNGATGFTTGAGTGGGIPSVNSQGGVTMAYNAGNGVRVAQDDFTAASFDDDSAFTANAQCGLFNTWLSDAVSAVNNQWRGSAPYVDTCVNEANEGPVTVGTPQDPNEEQIVLSAPSPSNVILKGQTIRVLGSGFNAITGNPLAGEAGCAVGVNVSGAGQGNSCCNKVQRANTCAGVNQPVDGGGNCVELRNGQMQWLTMEVKAVTPRMIEAQLPGAVFGCLGNSMELVRVHKKFSNTERLDSTSYCTQTDPL